MVYIYAKYAMKYLIMIKKPRNIQTGAKTAMIKTILGKITKLIYPKRYSILLNAMSDFTTFRWLLMSTGDKDDIFLMNVNESVKIYNRNKFWFQKRLPIHYKGIMKCTK